MSTWIKISNSMPANPKVITAGHEAMWLHVCGICYANEHLTDGKIEARYLPAVAVAITRPDRLVRRLVEAGLWDEIPGGWQIHDYEQHQRSASEIKKRRVAAAKRQAAWRESRISHTDGAAA